MNIIRHIPNTITSMNLLCGVLGVIFTLQGRFDLPFYLMLAAAVCDFLDGFAARMLKAYSAVGKELDSLADLISFGLLPGIMLYQLMSTFHPGEWVCYVPLVIVVFSAVRLAKFNVDERQTENFLGLATPACAMICGSFTYYTTIPTEGIVFFNDWVFSAWTIPAAAVILSLLLVSEIPMFSLKFKKGSSYNVIRFSFVIVALLAVAAAFILKTNWSFVILSIFSLYVIYNILRYLFTLRVSKK